MATLFAIASGNLSTAGIFYSAAATIANQGTVGSSLSATRPLTITSNTYTANAVTYGIALCLSSVGDIQPTDIIKISTGSTDLTYPASALNPGIYSNSYSTTAPTALVGWLLFRWGSDPSGWGFAWPTTTATLSIYGPSTIKLLGSSVTAPASMMLYNTYNVPPQPTDNIYLVKNFLYGGGVTNLVTTGSISAANVYICDGTVSNNVFNISNNAANNIYIGRGGIFTGSAVITGTAGGINQFINVLDGAILSANYATPTITGRIRAVSGAIVDLTNVSGFNMRSSGVYSNTTNPNNGFDYLHDITTGYAKFNNVSFWAGISSCNKTISASNLSATNCTFNGKYIFNNTLTATNDNLLSFDSASYVSNVLLSGLSCNENIHFSGNYNSFNLTNSLLYKELDIENATFSDSNLSNIRFASNSLCDAIVLSGTGTLPAFNDILITNRKVGIMKYDTRPISINGLSCLSSYSYAIYANDLIGSISNVQINDSIYGNADISFITNSANNLSISNLSCFRSDLSNISNSVSSTTAINVLSSYYTNGSSVLLSASNARVVSKLPNILTNLDDFTIETWYAPLDSTLPAAQSIVSIWNPLSTTAATNGCVLQLYVNTAGRLVLQKGASADGTVATVFTEVNNVLADRKWWHIALTKSQNIYSLYIDGYFAISASNANEFFIPQDASTYNVYIGARPASRTTFIDTLCGYIGGCKISYGVNYKGSFTPDTGVLKTTPGTLYNLNWQLSSAEYSKVPRVFMNLERNNSQQALVFNKLSFASSQTLSSDLIDLSNCKFEKFEMINSNLSTLGKPIVMSNNRDYVQGSYIFNNCTELNPIVDSNVITSYQPYNYKESGFAIQNANGSAEKNYKWTQGGKVSLDSNQLYNAKATEKLESISDKYALKSNSKLIPVSPSSSLNGVSIIYKTPISYVSGGTLMVSKNAALGIKDDIKLGDLTPTNDQWVMKTFSLSSFRNPVWNQKSYVEVYAELRGLNKQLNIAKWQISTL